LEGVPERPRIPGGMPAEPVCGIRVVDPMPPSFTPVENATLSQSQATTIAELIETFDALGDWEAQCDHLIDLGCEIPEFPELARTDANKVRGCQSNVWLIADVKPGEPPVVEILADSDSMIVKGLIAVLLMAYSGRTPQEILDTDIKGIFARLGLNRQLSSARRNGLFGMVERIRSIARQVAQPQAP
jgi:cysteine desulfuration protein SufE